MPSGNLEPNTDQLLARGRERLRSGEYPASVARDLSRQGLSENEIQDLFQAAATRRRRTALASLLAGASLSLLILFLVWGAAGAGLTCSGPGLLVGLIVMSGELCS